MSSTKLLGIKKEGWLGEEIKSYKNGMLFVPTVCDKLLHKYVPESERTKIDFDFSIIDSYLFVGNWKKLNDKINDSDCFTNRIMWDLCNSCIFSTKDKEKIANCIIKFMNDNSSDDYLLDIKRAKEIAEDIRNLDEKYKYFCIHGTSCDDNVERWFYDLEGEVAPLSDCCDPECCFVTISENNEISYRNCTEVTKKLN